MTRPRPCWDAQDSLAVPRAPPTRRWRADRPRQLLAPALARPLITADFDHVALYEQLAEQCGVKLTSGSERILPILPDRAQRDLLGIVARQPVFAVERLGLAGCQPVEWRHSIVCGDRFTFVTPLVE